MIGIVINVPSDGTIINCVHHWSLKSVDNAPPFFTGPQKVLLEIRHGNRTSIINTNRNSIGVKLSLDRMSTGVGCTSHASDVR